MRAPALLVLLLVPFFVQAQPVRGTLPDSIVVTASREAESVRQTGRRVTVLTAADIARLPVASFDELLRTAAGVEVFSRGTFGTQSDLTVRGSTFGGVLVLVDGVRFNDPMTGHFLSDFPLPLAEIARIEVLRGPASALYGPDAVGGVIQVFTFTALGAAQREASLSVAGGSHALLLADGALRVPQGGATLGAAAASGYSDGHRIANLDGTQGPLRAGFSRQAATIALRHPMRGLELFARAALDTRDFDAVRFYTPFASDTAREATETYWAQLGLATAEPAQTRFTLSLGARRHDDRYVYNPRTPANKHTSQQLTALAALHHTLRTGVTATMGITGSLRDIDSNNLGAHADAGGGAYVGLRTSAASGLATSSSLRLDYDPTYGAEVTPQLAASFSRGPVTLRAAGGRSVRAPSYVERYFNTELARPRGRDLGNPDLRAERAWTAEGGADLYGPRGLSLHATLFHRNVDNLIDFVKLAPADTVFRARNLLRVRTTGLETEINASREIGSARLRLALGYTYLHTALGDLAAGVQTKYALTTARHLGQATLTLDAGPFTLGVQSLVKEPQQGQAYSVHNARAAYRLPVSGIRLHATGEVRNVFDAHYTEVFASMPGRWFVAGLRAAL